MRTRTTSGKALIIIAALIGAIGIIIVGSVFLTGFIKERIFLAQFMAISKEQEEINRKFFENATKLSETAGASKESLAQAYAAILRTRIEDIKSGIEKTKALTGSAKCVTARDALLKILHSNVEMNESVYAAAAEGDMDKAVRLEEENEKSAKARVVEYLKSLKAAGIAVPDTDKAADELLEKAKALRDNP